MNFRLTYFLLVILLSCAGVKKGSVSKKIDARSAEIYMEEKEVKPGDRIEAFYFDCSYRMVPESHCLHTRTGLGTVKKNLDDQTSLVEFQDGSVFKEGTFIQKL